MSEHHSLLVIAEGEAIKLDRRFASLLAMTLSN
jgi:hypothetical protein